MIYLTTKPSQRVLIYRKQNEENLTEKDFYREKAGGELKKKNEKKAF